MEQDGARLWVGRQNQGRRAYPHPTSNDARGIGFTGEATAASRSDRNARAARGSGCRYWRSATGQSANDSFARHVRYPTAGLGRRFEIRNSRSACGGGESAERGARDPAGCFHHARSRAPISIASPAGYTSCHTRAASGRHAASRAWRIAENFTRTASRR